jgi:hypothetical protein
MRAGAGPGNTNAFWNRLRRNVAGLCERRNGRETYLIRPASSAPVRALNPHGEQNLLADPIGGRNRVLDLRVIARGHENHLSGGRFCRGSYAKFDVPHPADRESFRTLGGQRKLEENLIGALERG